MSIPSGTYNIVNIGQGTVLDLDVYSPIVVTSPRNGSSAQKWVLTSAGGTSYYIVNEESNGYLAPRSYNIPPAVGEPLWAGDSQRRYRWSLVLTSSSTFYISGNNEPLVVTAGPRVVIGSPTVGNSSQLWTLQTPA